MSHITARIRKIMVVSKNKKKIYNFLSLQGPWKVYPQSNMFRCNADSREIWNMNTGLLELCNWQWLNYAWCFITCGSASEHQCWNVHTSTNWEMHSAKKQKVDADTTLVSLGTSNSQWMSFLCSLSSFLLFFSPVYRWFFR